jgi:hypothetical protein
MQHLDKYAVKPNLLVAQLLSFDGTNPESVFVRHKIANEVGARYGIDLDKLKLMLLQKILTDGEELVTLY